MFYQKDEAAMINVILTPLGQDASTPREGGYSLTHSLPLGEQLSQSINAFNKAAQSGEHSGELELESVDVSFLTTAKAIKPGILPVPDLEGLGQLLEGYMRAPSDESARQYLENISEQGVIKTVLQEEGEDISPFALVGWLVSARGEYTFYHGDDVRPAQRATIR